MSGAVGRPGSGGRLPRALPFTGTSATAELIRELGQPFFDSQAGVQLLIWEVSKGGKGVIAARLSGAELQGGETAMGQVHPLRALAGRLDLAPRLIVVSVNNSGARRYEDRPDLSLIEDAVASGWCEWVAWSRPDRIAREILPAERCYQMLQESGTALYLGSLGRLVDWRRDLVVLRTLGIVSAEERQAIYERTRGAVLSRYIAEGRGWPASKRFGFRRNWATKFLEVDPEQWEFVKRIHYRYAELENEHGSGLRPLAAELRDLGCDLSHGQIRDILRSRMYVDGTFSVRVDGELVAQRPIPLPDPIPEGVFQRNQELLSLRRGRETRTRPGDFCLNGVPIRHARCEQERNGRDLRSLLKGRLLFGTVAAYRHSPWVPRQCHGYVLDQDVLEPAVLQALPALADELSIRRAWEDKQVVAENGFRPRLVEGQQTHRLRARLRQREMQKAQLTRGFLARADEGHELNERAYWELVGAISEEIAQLELRLERGETVATGPVGTRVDNDLRQALTDLVGPIEPSRSERARRAALVAAMLSGIRICDEGAAIVVELETPLLLVGSRRTVGADVA